MNKLTPYELKQKQKVDKRYGKRRQPLHVPKSALRYRAGKLHKLILTLEAQIEKDVSKVDLLKYTKLVKEFTDVTEDLKAERKLKGMDKKRVDSPSRQADKGTVGQRESDGVGDGVSPQNPFSK